MLGDMINQTLSPVVFMTCIGTALLVILKFTVYKILPFLLITEL